MITRSGAPPTETTPARPRPTFVNHDERAGFQVLLQSLSTPNPGGHRRCDRRYPFSQLITLSPVAADGVSPCGEAMVVVGRNISRQGLNFFHPQAIPHRKVIAVLDTPATGRIAFLLDLRWCRFTQQGWYESGARVLRQVEAGKLTKKTPSAPNVN